MDILEWPYNTKNNFGNLFFPRLFMTWTLPKLKRESEILEPQANWLFRLVPKLKVIIKFQERGQVRSQDFQEKGSSEVMG